MEARSAIRGTGISKGLVAVLVVSVTMGLGVTAGVVAKNLSGTAATQSHISQGQGQGGAAFENPARRGGLQMLGDDPAAAKIKAVGPDDRATTSTLAPNSFLGPDAQERNAKLAAPAAPLAKGHGDLP
jgi:hypothetical protein